MSWARIISILSAIAFFGGMAEQYVQAFSPEIAFWVSVVAGTVGFFSERIQGSPYIQNDVN